MIQIGNMGLGLKLRQQFDISEASIEAPEEELVILNRILAGILENEKMAKSMDEECKSAICKE